MTIMPELFYSSTSDEWRYHFTLDPCATAGNAKCPLFFTKEQNGLARDWGTHRVFCNPPYGRALGAWVRKCFEASQRGWFHDYVQGKARIEFCRGRARTCSNACRQALHRYTSNLKRN